MAVAKAVILARGLGTRMQRPVEDLRLGQEVEVLAERGWKPLIPIARNRPFLDYSIEVLRRAGFKKVCIVIGPEHISVKNYYEKVDRALPDLEIDFANQQEPLGTADAVYAAKEFAGSDSFVVANGDNLYSIDCLKMLRDQLEEICYVAGFEREALIAGSNYTAERVKKFAVMQVDGELHLSRIVEKPDNPEAYTTSYGILVNMNLFRFTHDIFWACERIKPHPVRGEFELSSAVQLLVDERRVPVKVLVARAGVLDLTYRDDIVAVRDRLQGLDLSF
ncbi:MAG: nucleotidyltransferase family protein [Candidatus Bathyarchaeota archaeon]|nr:nucleotidyltransferase family protein [Candidatus Bathyarchaeota archaeon]MDH5687826.1 nucleotidyltransferase family protein [Candidatus Bathyarchaeota archaeon]